MSVILVLVTLLGLASRAPGSLGGFDAAMLIGLGQFNREELVLRLLYLVLPFASRFRSSACASSWLIAGSVPGAY